MEEEVDSAGHPVLGAAAALHEETIYGRYLQGNPL